MLGPEKFYNETAERAEIPGVATGLAWTAAGGDILFIEATKMTGKGSLTLTGQLGDVMKESAQAALSYLRSKADNLGIPANFLEKTDIHIHFPADRSRKDGPSAGVTILTALVSLLTGNRVRSDVAMTGEVTLVLPVGGIKEKVLAAHRAGIKRHHPARNERDLVDVPEQARKELEFVFAAHMDEVLKAALEEDPIGRRLRRPSPRARRSPPAPRSPRRSGRSARPAATLSEVERLAILTGSSGVPGRRRGGARARRPARPSRAHRRRRPPAARGRRARRGRRGPPRPAHAARPRRAPRAEAEAAAGAAAALARAAGAQRLVHVSTAAVYGTPRNLPCREGELKAPRTALERIRWRAEQASWAEFRRGAPLTVLRPTILYGPTLTGGAVRALTFFTLLQQGRRRIPIIRRGPVAHLVHLDDLARAVVHVVGARR